MKEHFCPAEKSIISYQDQCNWCGEKEALAQEQEPVAMWDGKYQIEFGNLSAYKHGEHRWIPLYTAPPQRKPLTDEEYFEIGQRHWLPSSKVEQIYYEIEAKRKEKNT